MLLIFEFEKLPSDWVLPLKSSLDYEMTAKYAFCRFFFRSEDEQQSFRKLSPESPDQENQAKYVFCRSGRPKEKTESW